MNTPASSPPPPLAGDHPPIQFEEETGGLGAPNPSTSSKRGMRRSRTFCAIGQLQFLPGSIHVGLHLHKVEAGRPEEGSEEHADDGKIPNERARFWFSKNGPPNPKTAKSGASVRPCLPPILQAPSQEILLAQHRILALKGVVKSDS
jgi:hypothetical protein